MDRVFTCVKAIKAQACDTLFSTRKIESNTESPIGFEQGTPGFGI